MTIDYQTLRGLLVLEQFYFERGIAIDSLYKIVANCEEVGAMTTRAFERERAAFRSCEALSVGLMEENRYLKKSLNRSRFANYAMVAVLSGAITYMAVK